MSERAHVCLAVRAPRLDGDHRFDGAAYREAGMARRVAIAVAARTGGAGFAQAPTRAQPLTHVLRDERRVRLACGAHVCHLLRGDAEEAFAACAGVNDAAAKVISRRSGNRDERGIDEP